MTEYNFFFEKRKEKANWTKAIKQPTNCQNMTNISKITPKY
jgi:hypothetical protein